VFPSTISIRPTKRYGWAVLVALLLPQTIGAQDTPVVLRGTWTATAGTRVFNGVWSAQIEPGAPNGAHGSWGLLDGSGRVILQGTWAAQKRAKVWQGTWSAVVTRSGDRSSSGPKYAGSLQANVAGNESATLLEMFKRSVENAVSGTWQSGALKGQWTVRASSQETSRHASRGRT